MGYNKIADLKEVFRLKKCQNIINMDLRLNPVTGNEPDYRLFMAHMLPKLQRLDDRPLRDSERKSAILHFSSNEIPENSVLIKEIQGSGDNNENKKIENKSRQPRVESVKKFVRKPTFVTDEDTVNDVIDLQNKIEIENQASNENNKPKTIKHTKKEL